MKLIGTEPFILSLDSLIHCFVDNSISFFGNLDLTKVDAIALFFLEFLHDFLKWISLTLKDIFGFQLFVMKVIFIGIDVRKKVLLCTDIA